MEINYNTTEDAIYTAAVQRLDNLLVQYDDVPVLLLLSGGFALKLLDHIDLASASQQLFVTMLDERLSTDPAISNFGALTKTVFYRDAKDQGAHFIDTRPAEDEHVEELAMRCSRSLRAVLTAHKDLVIIATMGVGADGHTAGIMPYPEDEEFFDATFVSTTQSFIGYDAGTKNQFPLRMSVTISFLRDRVDHAVMLATDAGGDRDALTRVQSDHGKLYNTPARVVRDMQDVSIFTDITLTS